MARRIKTFIKQPADNLDYDFDFSQWLATGDTLSSSVVTSDPGITLGTKIQSATNIKQFVSGGTDGQEYKVSTTITTTNGLDKQVDILIAVREE